MNYFEVFRGFHEFTSQKEIKIMTLNTFTKLAIYLTLSLPLLTHARDHTSYKIISSPISPWSINNELGIFPEIISEIEHRLGRNTKLTILPWSRAQHIAKKEKNVIIFPLARVTNRENLYLWVVPVFLSQLVFASLNGKSLDIEEAKKLPSVLVHMETPPHFFLKSKGFNNIVPSTGPIKKLTKILLKNRVSTWFSAKVLTQISVKGTPAEKAITYGPPAFKMTVYIAASKGTSNILIKEYRSTFSKIKADGSLDKIMKRYIGKPFKEYIPEL